MTPAPRRPTAVTPDATAPLDPALTDIAAHVAVIHALATAYAHGRFTHAPTDAKRLGRLLHAWGVPLKTGDQEAESGRWPMTAPTDEPPLAPITLPWLAETPLPVLPAESHAVWPSTRARRSDLKRRLLQLMTLQGAVRFTWAYARRAATFTNTGAAAHANAAIQSLCHAGLLGGPHWYDDNGLTFALDVRGAAASGLTPEQVAPWYWGLERIDELPGHRDALRAANWTLAQHGRVVDLHGPYPLADLTKATHTLMYAWHSGPRDTRPLPTWLPSVPADPMTCHQVREALAANPPR